MAEKVTAKKVTFVNQNNKSFKVSLYGPEKNRVRVATVLAAFKASQAFLADEIVMEADNDGLSVDTFAAGATYNLIVRLVVPQGRKDDKSRSWSEAMLLKELPELPQDEGTSLEVIQEAYNVANGCKFLARARGEPKLIANIYSVRIVPLGCEVKLDSEQDGKKFAQNACTALAALHRNGIVHRDVRLPNIVKVFESQTEYYFIVIDLETVAKADFELPKGFDCFRFWTRQTLEGKCYTPRSDMYHLGLVLKGAMKDSAKSLAKSFIGDLISKQFDAEMALRHPWLSDEVL